MRSLTTYPLNSSLGDIVYLNICKQPMIVLGSHEAATELLDKRSAIYSDRPLSPMVELYVSRSSTFPL